MSQPEKMARHLLSNEASSSQSNPIESPPDPDSPPPAKTNQPSLSSGQQQALMETAASLLGVTSPDVLWPIVIESVQAVLQADRAAIFLYDTESDHVSSPFAAGLSSAYIEAICRQAVYAPSYALWYVQEPLVIDDIERDDRTAHVREIMRQEGFRTYAIFPLMTGDDGLLGAVIAYRNEPRPFQPTDIAAGQTLAHMGALALNNSQLFSQTRLNLIREQKLNEFSRTLASALDLPSILGNVIRTACEIIAADAGLLGLIIDHQVMTFYPYDIPPQIVLRPASRGDGLGWRCVQEEHSIYLEDYQAYHGAQERWLKAGLTSVMAVPIRAADNYLGSLILFNLKWSNRRFAEREVALVESLGRQAGIAIQNARMYAEAKQRTTALRNALNRQAELDDLKNKFVQNVSHELRTPLGIIYGHTDLLNSGVMGNLEQRQADSVHIIHRRVRMLIDLVNDLTALLATESQEMRREVIDPVVLAYAMVAEYRLQSRDAKITLKSEIQEPLPLIMGDLTHLRRVFDNLFSNAFKFTPDAGLVSLKVWAERQAVLFEISDSGIGIPADKLDRIFDRFYQIEAQTTRRYPGTGLGLALVKEIIEAHRGEVFVTSELGVGTTFRIQLPAAPPADS